MSGFSVWNVELALVFLSTSSFLIRMMDEVSPSSAVILSTSLRSYVLMLALQLK